MPAEHSRHFSADSNLRHLARQWLCRASGAPLIAGNRVDLLVDAPETFPPWLAEVRGARHRVLVENYIFRDDEVGREFLAALVGRAEAGVHVFVIYDWLGCRGQSRAGFWRPLLEAGGQVRRYNPFQFGSPLGWLNRDHRKLLLVDRTVGFLGGLCVSAKWLGKQKSTPWRDTAVAVRGPAVLEFEQAFAAIWEQLGSPMRRVHLDDPVPAGDVDVRVIATQPDTAGIFRLDQLIAAMAQRSLWLADAYFVGVAPYVQALVAASRDGVDVRLLVPGASDLPVVAAISQSGYRPLLEAGVRVFEWNGSMMHAKTAVADGRWARVGSSNLNVASWLGNCEIDIAVENVAFAATMEEQYLRDLENCTEIVLTAKRRVRRSRARPSTQHAGGSSGRAAASALRLAHSVGAALGNRRVLGQKETAVLPWLVVPIFLFAIVGVVWPRVLAWPLAVFAAWIGIVLLSRYLRSRGKRAAVAAPAAVAEAERAPAHESRP